MKTTYSTPAWAVMLVKQVCTDYSRAMPTELHWYSLNIGGGYDKIDTADGGYKYIFKARNSSSGNTGRHNGRIHISAGADEQDQKLVLLHELAHHIMNKTKKGRAANHNTTFWMLAFELYKKYDMNMTFAFDREKSYRKTAITVFNKFYKENA